MGCSVSRDAIKSQQHSAYSSSALSAQDRSDVSGVSACTRWSALASEILTQRLDEETHDVTRQRRHTNWHLLTEETVLKRIQEEEAIDEAIDAQSRSDSSLRAKLEALKTAVEDEREERARERANSQLGPRPTLNGIYTKGLKAAASTEERGAANVVNFQTTPAPPPAAAPPGAPLSPPPPQQPSATTPFESTENDMSVGELFNIMNQGIVRPYLEDTDYLLLVDCRPDAASCAQVILTATPVSSLSACTTTTPDASHFPAPDEHVYVVLYDTDGCRGGGGGPARSLCSDLNALGFDAAVLRGGLAAFALCYPTLCGPPRAHWGAVRAAYASQQLPNEICRGLYLGNCHHAASTAVREALGLKFVLNVSVEHPNTHVEHCEYHNVRIGDEKRASLLKELPMACNFLDRALAAEGNVLVHCTMGVSRSAAIVTAYLMKCRGWRLPEALECVRDARQGVRPNYGFLQQLAEWEGQVFGNVTSNVDRLLV